MYSYFSVKLANDVLNQREEESNKDYDETFLLRWIVSAIFTAREICISLLMMCKLRVRFAYFYKEYGCFLWTVVTIQGVSLLIQTIINALISENEAVKHWVYSASEKQVLYSILSISYNIIAFIVPALNQLSCLVFVWIRTRRGSKELQTHLNANNQTIHYVDESLQKRPDYISIFDPTVEYYMVDVAKYLPKRK